MDYVRVQEGIPDPGKPPETSGEARLDIQLDWELIPSPSGASDPAYPWLDSHGGSDGVTAFGVRVEPSQADEALTQAINRQNGETHGTVTLTVPHTEQAVVYVVGVDDNADVVHWLGVRRDVVIADDVVQLTTDDFEWTEARWEFLGFYESYASDVAVDVVVNETNDGQVGLLLPEDTSSAVIRSRVRDPWQLEGPTCYYDLFLRFYGTGFVDANQGGWRQIEGLLSIGPHGSTFQPVVSNELFALPGLLSPSVRPIVNIDYIKNQTTDPGGDL